MKNFIIFIGLVLCSFILNAQQDTIVDSSYYYYYNGEKVYLSPKTDRMLVKLADNANRNRLQNLIQADDTIEVVNSLLNDTLNKFVILQAKPDRVITSSTINKYKSSPDIVCSFPMLEYNKSEVLQGLTDEFIVKLKSTTTLAQLQSLVTNYNCVITPNVLLDSTLFFIHVSSSSLLNSLQLANVFYETGFFDFAEPDFLLENAIMSNDPLYAYQWGLNNTASNGVDINIEKAWKITEGSSNINTAVVDCGVDRNNVDLSPNLIEGVNVLDFLNTNNVYASMTQGTPKYDNDNHGTACAGIIGAVKNNGIGISGVAPNSKIMPINIGSFGITHYTVTNSSLAVGILSSSLFGADVISNSWGGGSPSNTITNMINLAVSQGRNGKGCVVVFAAGNDNSTVSYPAYLSNVIAVGAIDETGHRASFSNYGLPLDVVAPGVHIATTDRVGNYGYNDMQLLCDNDIDDLNYTQCFRGTSAACPYVAGVAALILSVNPDLTQQQVRYIIEQTAQKLDAYTYLSIPICPNGTWNNETGYGLVDAYAAVALAKSFTCRNNEQMVTGTINTNTTLSNDAFVYGDLTVASGTTLIINSTVRCAYNSKIIVMPNAKLVVNGGTITSACPDLFWKGINVVGTYGQPQAQQYQGYVELNNATIENAKNAISLWYPEEWGTTGGIIKATNTTFRNNLRSVEFMAYHNHNANGAIIDNVSSFTNCTFVWDENLIANDKTEFAHVTMWDVEGVKFTKCYFSKADEYNEEVSTLTHGILSELSGFNVRGLLQVQNSNLSVEPSKFNNLTYGVRAGNLENKTFNVANSVFDTNFCGVFASRANNFGVLFCDFNIRPDYDLLVNPNIDYIRTSAVGIFSDVSTGYRIINNNFYGKSFPMLVDPPSNTVGVQIQNSGEEPNAVNNNVFHNLYGGSQALGKNRSRNVKVGLKYYCNEFKRSTFGLYITKQNTNDPNVYGICEEQRTLSIPAFNTFDNNHTDICNRNCPKIYYTYSSLFPNTYPTLCNTNVIPIDIPTEENNCQFVGNLFTKTEMYEHKELLESQYILLLYNYNNLLDGGQTDILLDKLEDGWNGDVWALREEYLGISPYLSFEVLREMVNSEVLPLAVCTEILLSNPEATQQDEFKDFMYNAETYLTPLAISLVEESWNARTFRANVESNLSAKLTELENTSREIIQIILTDTNGININEYQRVLSEMKSISSKFELAESYIGQKQYNFARNILYNLQGNENYTEEINDYLDYIDLLEAVDNPYNLSEDVLLDLSEHNTIIGRKAKSMLYFKRINTDYHPFVINMENEPENKSTRVKGSLNDLVNTDIVVQPNPAKDYISVTYNLPPKQTYTLQIYDNMGKQILVETLKGNRGMQTIDLKQFKSGSYTYSITNSKRVIKSDKLVIIK